LVIFIKATRIACICLRVAAAGRPLIPKARKAGAKQQAGDWHNDPCRYSLGLLPSGPDPIGEWRVHHQPPAVHIANSGTKSKQKMKNR